VAAQRPEELRRVVRVQRRRSSAGSDVDLHDEEAALGLLGRYMQSHDVLHDHERLTCLESCLGSHCLCLQLSSR
jgi:hypothetical protein